jgi:hypothetical protein
MRRTPNAALASGERVAAEVACGGTTAMLTDRRVVVVDRRGETSLPLSHIALARVRFEHSIGAFVCGVILLLGAAMLLAPTPVRTALHALEVAMAPLAGWLLAAAGVAAMARGFIGRTAVTIVAGGAKVVFAHRGRRRALHDFAADLGRQLPDGERFDSMTAPTLPMPAPERRS